MTILYIEIWGKGLGLTFRIDFDDLKETNLFDTKLIAVFKKALDQSSYVTFSHGKLVHGDLHIGNTLVDKDIHPLKAIIDPWGWIGGMPMYDLAYASLPWQYSFSYHEQVIKSYNENGGIFNAEEYFISLLVIAYWEERKTTDSDNLHKIKYVISHIPLPELV